MRLCDSQILSECVDEIVNNLLKVPFSGKNMMHKSAIYDIIN